MGNVFSHQQSGIRCQVKTLKKINSTIVTNKVYAMPYRLVIA